MNKIFGTEDKEEALYPLWLTVLTGLAVVSVLAAMMVYFFGASSL
jgi:hypothetical protein